MNDHFLHGAQLASAITQTLGGARRDIAVAFIGKGALERAALADARGARIICDLWSGGCNPEAIRELHAAGATIKNLPHLHAKIYRGARDAIIGSANLSSNGFADDGAEQLWGLEAGVRIAEPATLTAIDSWFEAQFDAALPFDPDGSRLDEAWSRRPRRPRVDIAPDSIRSILAHALRYPDAFRNIGFVLTNTNNSSEATKQANKEANLDSDVDYSNWPGGRFTKWGKKQVRQWPTRFFAFHITKQKRLYLDAMGVEKLDASSGWVFARREWPDIAKRIAPGLTKAAVHDADREIALQILGKRKGGRLFSSARELADWCARKRPDLIGI